MLKNNTLKQTNRMFSLVTLVYVCLTGFVLCMGQINSTLIEHRRHGVSFDPYFSHFLIQPKISARTHYRGMYNYLEKFESTLKVMLKNCNSYFVFAGSYVPATDFKKWRGFGQSNPNLSDLVSLFAKSGKHIYVWH
jgi:hypothetical protein